MKVTSIAPAYDENYLDDMIIVHECLFSRFEKNKDYDIFSMIDSYMRYSSIRRKMDLGNWSALNKSTKQLYNDTDLSVCSPKAVSEEYDDFLLGWIAKIYVLFQWKYNLPSSLISMEVPAEEMARIYYPLHETSENNACEKIWHRYFEGLRF